MICVTSAGFKLLTAIVRYGPLLTAQELCKDLDPHHQREVTDMSSSAAAAVRQLNAANLPEDQIAGASTESIRQQKLSLALEKTPQPPSKTPLVSITKSTTSWSPKRAHADSSRRYLPTFSATLSHPISFEPWS